jgi:hypothetical protein
LSEGTVVGEHSASGTFDTGTVTVPPLYGGAVSSPHGWTAIGGYLDSFSAGIAVSSSHPHGSVDGDGHVVSSPTDMALYLNGTTRFTGDAGMLAVKLTGYSEWNYSGSEQALLVTLTDTTTGTVLMRSDIAYDWEGASSERAAITEIDVDPSHEYSVNFSGFVHAFDSKYASLFASVEFAETQAASPVPDGGGTLFLLSLAALVFVARPRAQSS